jgi:hypothetical protein
MAASLEALSAEKRGLEGRLAQAQAEGAAADRERRSLSQQARDLGQQVARLLHEAQAAASGLPRDAAGGTPAASFAGGNASDVTTQRLVEFRDIEVCVFVCVCLVVGGGGGAGRWGRWAQGQTGRAAAALPACKRRAGVLRSRLPLAPCLKHGPPSPLCAWVPRLPQDLQQQNARLLVVNRQLSQEAEATRAEAEAALRAEHEAALQGVLKQLEGLRAGRQAAEKMLQQARAGSGAGAGRGQGRWLLRGAHRMRPPPP